MASLSILRKAQGIDVHVAGFMSSYIKLFVSIHRLNTLDHDLKVNLTKSATYAKR